VIFQIFMYLLCNLLDLIYSFINFFFFFFFFFFFLEFFFYFFSGYVVDSFCKSNYVLYVVENFILFLLFNNHVMCWK